MNEYLEEAQEELKRVDHIIYVSLKYTRTVDIIRNALHRMLSACDFIVAGILEHNKEEKKIKKVPDTPKQRIDLLRELYKDDVKLNMYVTFYVFLRELIKVPFKKIEEYRRHVAMIAELKNKTVEVNIDTLEDNYDKIAKDFLAYAVVLTEGTPDE